MADPATHLLFGQHHLPTLKAGNYQLQVIQSLGLGADSEVFNGNLDFAILGERFSLPPSAIHSVFPPANSLGEYSSVLPHLVLNRTTLPWERHAQAFVDGESTAEHERKLESPWLALLVFWEGELEVMTTAGATPTEEEKHLAETGYSLTLQNLVDKFGGLTDFEGAAAGAGEVALEAGQHPEDRVSVIFSKRSTLEPLLPSFAQLHHLTHTRQGADASGNNVGAEMSVVIANRLPPAGAECVVHLVSVEDRYDDSGFDFGSAGAEDPIPLVSLKSWRFSSLSHRHTFRGLLLHLNQRLLFRQPVPAPDKWHSAPTDNATTFIGEIRTLFLAGKHPLGNPDGSGGSIAYRANREVVSRDYHFLIDTSRQVYTQAGTPLVGMGGYADDATLISALAAAFPDFPATATPRDTDHPYLWIADGTGPLFFLREEKGFLLAYQLEQDQSPTLRVPEVGETTADAYLEQGYVPLPHLLRNGGKSVSWFRGPLATGERTADNLGRDIFQVRTADELLRYHQSTGMFDVSYAAAWELGRLLALQSKTFSVGLHKWRRKHARAAADEEHREAHVHLPYAGSTAADNAAFPPALHNWLERLWTLEGIPYNYLLPDDRMLPAESLRFFTLDPDWMAALVHGAFSIGRDSGTNHWATDHDQHPANQTHHGEALISGFLLKSEVVSGWPGLIVEVTGDHDGNTGVPLETVRRQLGPNLLLFQVAGTIKKVDFHLKPETLHFGFHREEDDGPFVKSPRGPDGTEMSVVVDLEDPSGTGSPVILSRPEDAGYNGVLNLEELFTALHAQWTVAGFTGDFKAAQFALAMIEGVEKVSYLRK